MSIGTVYFGILPKSGGQLLDFINYYKNMSQSFYKRHDNNITSDCNEQAAIAKNPRQYRKISDLIRFP